MVNISKMGHTALRNFASAFIAEYGEWAVLEPPRKIQKPFGYHRLTVKLEACDASGKVFE